ncbi:MAG TPA: metal ABC transporter substrate-binding protein [Solirubrobacteraceae bacterium]|nr:metal ABC transporter substrate-binding protein [Solirubrobacteraceae bacterium]
MPLRAIVAPLAAALAAALLAACGSGGGDARGDRAAASVVATTTQVADLARAVAGRRATVRQILQPSSDPHDYEPRPSDVAAVAGADIVLRSGGDVDEWLDGVLRNAGSDAGTVTLLDAAVRRRESDPHWWHDPRNAIAAVERIRDALVAADPAGRATYAANAAAYVGRLRRLDDAIAACMRAIPEDRRKLVTDHDALGYFADRYGIEVVGTVIPSRSTQAQASAGEVARLARTIRSAGVETIFPESSGSPKLTRAIAREAGARVGPALYADTLGEAGGPGDTYLKSLVFNARALAAGFGGDPDRCRP